jgi:hypothetical protein
MKKATKKATKSVPLDPARAVAVFEANGLRVTLDLDGRHDGVLRTTAIEAARRTAHRMIAWSQVVAVAPKDAASPAEMVAMMSDSEAELKPAIRLGLATVTTC